MADYELDSLNLKVTESGTENAIKKLQKLSQTLKSIKKTAMGGSFDPLNGIGESADNIKNSSLKKLYKLTATIKSLSSIKVSASIANQITRISTAVDGLKDIDMGKFAEMADGIKAIGNTKVGNVRVSTPKIDVPEIQQLDLRTTISKGGTERVKESLDVIHDKVSALNGMEIISESTTSKAVRSLDKIKSKTNFIDKLKAKIKDTDKSTARATVRMGKFFQSLKRIAMYRLIRSALSAITKGLKEGTQNLYQFDKASGGSFSKSMDKIATSFLYLKNSIGTILAPLIELVAPAVDYLIDKWVELNNWISQFIARMTGQSTWKKALRYPVEYAESADNATKANEKLKRSILGIDELNILSDNTSSLADSSNSRMNYKEMFEESVLDKNVSEFIESLAITVNDVFFDWSELTGEQIAKKIIAGLGMLLGAVTGFTLGGVPGAILGTIAGAALTTVFSSLLFDNDGKLSATEIIGMILPVLGSLVGTVIGFKAGGPQGALIGASIGAGLTMGIMSLLLKKDGDGNVTKESLVQSIITVSTALIGAIAGFIIGKGKAGALIGLTIGSAIGFSITDLTFDGNGKMSSSETWALVIEAISTIIGAAIGFSIGGAGGAALGASIGVTLGLGIQSIFFTTDGNGNKVERAWLGALKGEVLELWANCKINVSDLWLTCVEVWNDLKEGTKTFWASFVAILSDTWNNAVQNWNDLKETTKELWAEFKAFLSRSWENAVQVYNNLKDKTVTAYAEAKEKVKDGLKNLKTKIDSVKGKTAIVYADAKEKSKNVIQGIKNKIKGVTGKTVTIFADAKDKIKGGIVKWWTDKKDSIKNKTVELTTKLNDGVTNAFKTFVRGIIQKLNDFLAACDRIIPGDQSGWKISTPAWAYANGGFPAQGEMFIANEAGPELVGRIGRKTAVANQDQIVASVSGGVSQGVYEANAEQNALLREQNELLRRLLAKDNTAVITTSKMESAFDRANRRNGKVGVPVGA